MENQTEKNKIISLKIPKTHICNHIKCDKIILSYVKDEKENLPKYCIDHIGYWNFNRAFKDWRPR